MNLGSLVTVDPDWATRARPPPIDMVGIIYSDIPGALVVRDPWYASLPVGTACLVLGHGRDALYAKRPMALVLDPLGRVGWIYLSNVREVGAAP